MSQTKKEKQILFNEYCTLNERLACISVERIFFNFF